MKLSSDGLIFNSTQDTTHIKQFSFISVQQVTYIQKYTRVFNFFVYVTHFFAISGN